MVTVTLFHRALIISSLLFILESMKI